MDDEEILELVANGEIDPSEISDFKDLDDELQDLVASGEIDLDDAKELNG